MLSTARDEAQECINLVTGGFCGLRSVTSARMTVSTMKATEAPNTQCGMFWSMIQPNNNGLKMPLKLKPVETMPKARPAAPGGAALRTSMSREGAITPPRNPAIPIAAEAGGCDLSMAGGAVGEIAAGQHARSTCAEKRGQRDVRCRESDAVARHQRDHAEIADAGIRQAEQHEEQRQHDDCRRHDALFCR